MVQENICHTYIHHKFIMQDNRQQILFFASNGLKDLFYDYFLHAGVGSSPSPLPGTATKMTTVLCNLKVAHADQDRSSSCRSTFVWSKKRYGLESELLGGGRCPYIGIRNQWPHKRTIGR